MGSAACLLLGAPQNFSWSSVHCCWCCQWLKPWMQEIQLRSCWASLSASLDSVPVLACMPGKEMDSNDFKKMLKWNVFPNIAWGWGPGFKTSSVLDNFWKLVVDNPANPLTVQYNRSRPYSVEGICRICHHDSKMILHCLWLNNALEKGENYLSGGREPRSGSQ